jgi:hypothetical protein
MYLKKTIQVTSIMILYFIVSVMSSFTMQVAWSGIISEFKIYLLTSK